MSKFLVNKKNRGHLHDGFGFFYNVYCLSMVSNDWLI